MLGPIAIFGAEALEAPDVVAEVHPGGEPVFHQIVQVSVDSRPIESERNELLCQIRVAQGRVCGLESAEDLKPGHRGPEASLTEDCFQVDGQ